MTGIKKAAPFNQYGIRTGDAKVHFCPGNHEDWEDLNDKADFFKSVKARLDGIIKSLQQ